MRNLVTEVEEEPAPELGEIHITCCIVLPFLLTSCHPEKYQLVPKQKNYVSAMPKKYRLLGYIFTYTDKSLFTRSLEADLMFGNVFISSPFGNISKSSS